MTQGILYRYDADSESEKAQLVVPKQERKQLLQEYHDSPTACHEGAERTLTRININSIGQYRKDMNEYVKSCITYQRYKPSSWKPVTLLQTVPFAQRFEVIANDFFGQLPITKNGNKWILIIENTASNWGKLFAMLHTTVGNSVKILIEEIFLRYGIPRKIVSDNGVQFVSEVVQ